MFTLDQVVPWGRSFDEYCAMFAIDEADLTGRILGCADGPASFNIHATRRGTSVVSCDPIYRFSPDEIRSRIEQTAEQIVEQTRQNADEFVWHSIGSVNELRRVRMAAMQDFLADFPAGRVQERYVAAELPSLSFPEAAFDLALCSHFLFLYSGQLGEAFHQAAVLELCRVAREVRIFPLLALGGVPSLFVEPCVRVLRQAGHVVAIEQVPYEFQRGGNQMLRVSRSG